LKHTFESLSIKQKKTPVPLHLMRIIGYLLDIDGTLLDSREAHARAWQRTLAARGIETTSGEITFDFAAPDADVVPDLFGIDDPSEVDQIVQEKNEYFLGELATIPLFSGVPEVLTRIIMTGGAICFVSSNFDRVIEGILAVYGWENLGAHFVGLDGVTKAKPDPEMVLKGIEKLDWDANKCVMVGDSPADIQAGQAAGARTIAVCSSGNTPEKFAQFHPEITLNTIADLLPLIPLEFD